MVGTHLSGAFILEYGKGARFEGEDHENRVLICMKELSSCFREF